MITIGTKIYYTGDMANFEGVFEVFGIRAPGCYDLRELPGEYDREFLGVHDRNIGREYRGHCNPRFVTLEARDAYRAERIVQRPL